MANRKASYPAKAEDADIAAIKALAAGVANAGQQKRALEWILFQACGIRDEVFAPGEADVTVYRAGRRNVGLQIAALIEHKPKAVSSRGAPPAMPLPPIEAEKK